MAGNFEIDEDGLVKAQIGIRAKLGYKDRVKHLVNRAARAAEVTMKAQAPHGKTGGFVRAINKTQPHFRPGGAGGGGAWVAVVGVTRTPETTTSDGHSYPTHVFQGTGVFGPRGSFIKTAPGNVMIIEDFKARDIDRGAGKVLGGRTGHLKARHLAGRPGVIFTHWVEGQRPQRDWYDAGRNRAQIVISSNYHRIFRMGDRMDDI